MTAMLYFSGGSLPRQCREANMAFYPLPPVLAIARYDKVNWEDWQLSINFYLFSIILIFIHN